MCDHSRISLLADSISKLMDGKADPDEQRAGANAMISIFFLSGVIGVDQLMSLTNQGAQDCAVHLKEEDEPLFQKLGALIKRNNALASQANSEMNLRLSPTANKLPC